MAMVGRLMEQPWIIALVSLVGGALVGAFSKAVWFGRNAVTKDDLIAATATMTTELHGLRSEIDTHSREIGETITALRTHVLTIDRDTTKKITEVELYVRDTFVRRDSWHKAMDQMQERWAAAEVAEKERALRIEAKVDRIIERLMGEK
jgi:hypothetical protein